LVFFFYLVYCCAYLFIVNLMSSDSSSLTVFPYSFFYDRETTDSYTIAAAPNLESVLRGPSFIYSSFDNRSKSSLDIDGKTPFLSSEGLNQSTWWEKASVQRHFSGELPIGYGCTFTQTVFNSTILFHCNLVTMHACIQKILQLNKAMCYTEDQ